ncbi:hypothetical protein PCE1_001375 [Barthelona sp. PCE]
MPSVYTRSIAKIVAVLSRHSSLHLLPLLIGESPNYVEFLEAVGRIPHRNVLLTVLSSISTVLEEEIITLPPEFNESLTDLPAEAFLSLCSCVSNCAIVPDSPLWQHSIACAKHFFAKADSDAESTMVALHSLCLNYLGIRGVEKHGEKIKRFIAKIVAKFLKYALGIPFKVLLMCILVFRSPPVLVWSLKKMIESYEAQCMTYEMNRFWQYIASVMTEAEWKFLLNVDSSLVDRFIAFLHMLPKTSEVNVILMQIATVLNRPNELLSIEKKRTFAMRSLHGSHLMNCLRTIPIQTKHITPYVETDVLRDRMRRVFVMGEGTMCFLDCLQVVD